MTAAEIILAIRRRWYVMLAALLCAIGFTALLAHGSGVYTTRTIVQFIHLEPDQGAISPNSDIENGNFIAFAGAVASEVNNGRPIMRYAWEDAPLYGAGVRQGVLVGLPDSGGQWVTSYNRAEIEIQIAGRTREWVEAKQRELVNKVFDSSRSLQGPAYNYRQSIRTSVVPLTATIEHVHPSRLQQLVAAFAMVSAAIIVGGWGSVRVDLIFESRARRRSRSAVSPVALDKAGVL